MLMPLKRERNAWQIMIQRCTDPGQKDWRYCGGAGIRVCQPWMASFDQFLADMGQAPSQTHWLGRLNVKGHYEPANCVWTTQAQQSCRRANCQMVELDGQRMTIAEASRELKTDQRRFRQRIVGQGRSVLEAANQGALPRRNARWMTYEGETLTVSQWSQRLNVPRTLLLKRLYAGWPVDRILRPERRPCRISTP